MLRSDLSGRWTKRLAAGTGRGSDWCWRLGIGEVDASLFGFVDFDLVDPVALEESLVAAFLTREEVKTHAFDPATPIGCDHAAIVNRVEAGHRETVEFGEVHQGANFNVRRR